MDEQGCHKCNQRFCRLYQTTDPGRLSADHGKWYAKTSGTEREKRQKEIIDKNYKRAAGQINLSVLLPVFSCYICEIKI